MHYDFCISNSANLLRHVQASQSPEQEVFGKTYQAFWDCFAFANVSQLRLSFLMSQGWHYWVCQALTDSRLHTARDVVVTQADTVTWTQWQYLLTPLLWSRLSQLQDWQMCNLFWMRLAWKMIWRPTMTLVHYRPLPCFSQCLWSGKYSEIVVITTMCQTPFYPQPWCFTSPN